MNPLEIKINSEGQEKPVFEGKNVPIEIRLFNPGPAVVGAPTEFIQKAGPSIKLIDQKTGAAMSLKRNLADMELLKQFKMIAPQKFEAIRWVIYKSEVNRVPGEGDITVEVTIAADIQVNGKTVPFTGKGTMTIVRP